MHICFDGTSAEDRLGRARCFSRRLTPSVAYPHSARGDTQDSVHFLDNGVATDLSTTYQK